VEQPSGGVAGVDEGRVGESRAWSFWVERLNTRGPSGYVDMWNCQSVNPSIASVAVNNRSTRSGVCSLAGCIVTKGRYKKIRDLRSEEWSVCKI